MTSSGCSPRSTSARMASSAYGITLPPRSRASRRSPRPAELWRWRRRHRLSCANSSRRVAARRHIARPLARMGWRAHFLPQDGAISALSHRRPGRQRLQRRRSGRGDASGDSLRTLSAGFDRRRRYDLLARGDASSRRKPVAARRFGLRKQLRGHDDRRRRAQNRRRQSFVYGVDRFFRRGSARTQDNPPDLDSARRRRRRRRRGSFARGGPLARRVMVFAQGRRSVPRKRQRKYGRRRRGRRQIRRPVLRRRPNKGAPRS